MLLCSLVQFARVVLVHVIVDGVLGVLIVVLIGLDEVLVIDVAICSDFLYLEMYSLHKEPWMQCASVPGVPGEPLRVSMVGVDRGPVAFLTVTSLNDRPTLRASCLHRCLVLLQRGRHHARVAVRPAQAADVVPVHLDASFGSCCRAINIVCSAFA